MDWSLLSQSQRYVTGVAFAQPAQPAFPLPQTLTASVGTAGASEPLVSVGNTLWNPDSRPVWQQEGFPNLLEYQGYLKWVARNNLNAYGDPKDTVYAGGTPLFDEATGTRIPLYVYATQNRPDKPWLQQETPGQSPFSGPMGLMMLFLMLALFTTLAGQQRNQ